MDTENAYEGAERQTPEKKKDADRRGRKIQLLVRLSEAEAERMNRIRERTSLSAARIVRRWIDEQPLPDYSTDRLVGELRRQGGLLKHTAFSGHLPKPTAQEILEIAQGLAGIAAKVEDTIRGNSD